MKLKLIDTIPNMNDQHEYIHRIQRDTSKDICNFVDDNFLGFEIKEIDDLCSISSIRREVERLDWNE